jgi:DNA-binding MarR family transcriptional regulator
MEVVALLEQLGFGEYEARAYVALVQHGAVTGYELAKVSGIPRANIYSVLQKLEDRGAVVRIEEPNTLRYTPVSVEELLERMERQFQTTLHSARHELRHLARPSDPGYLWNINSYTALLEHLRAVVVGAKEHLLVGVYPQEARVLADIVSEIETKNIELITLCMASCPAPCGGCRGTLYRYQTLAESDTRWILVVADGKEVIAGEIQGTSEATAIRSRQLLLVQLTGWFIRHTIALATVVHALGHRLEQFLEAEDREVLASIGPDHTAGDWLSYVRQLLPNNKG